MRCISLLHTPTQHLNPSWCNIFEEHVCAAVLFCTANEYHNRSSTTALVSNKPVRQKSFVGNYITYIPGRCYSSILLLFRANACVQGSVVISKWWCAYSCAPIHQYTPDISSSFLTLCSKGWIGNCEWGNVRVRFQRCVDSPGK